MQSSSVVSLISLRDTSRHRRGPPSMTIFKGGRCFSSSWHLNTTRGDLNPPPTTGLLTPMVLLCQRGTFNVNHAAGINAVFITPCDQASPSAAGDEIKRHNKTRTSIDRRCQGVIKHKEQSQCREKKDRIRGRGRRWSRADVLFLQRWSSELQRMTRWLNCVEESG